MEYVAAIVAVAIALIGLFAWRRISAERSFSSFALEHNLSLADEGLWGRSDMQGDYRGHHVRIHTEQSSYTNFSVALPDSIPTGLVMYERGLTQESVKFFGGQTIEIGRPELDEQFTIKGDDPQHLRSYLDRDPIISAFSTVQNACEDVQVRHGMLTVRQHGFIHDHDELERILDALARCANELERAGSPEAYARTIPPGQISKNDVESDDSSDQRDETADEDKEYAKEL